MVGLLSFNPTQVHCVQKPMDIYLGNITFSQVEEKLGYRLTDDDKPIWDEFHNDKADLSGKDSSFHVFDLPRCIQFKGEPAKEAILRMFTKDKLVKQMGQFMVYQVD